jgi:hypothetical protein
LDLRLSDGVTLSDEGADVEVEDTYEDRLTIRTLNEQSHYTTDLSPNPEAGVATYVHGELITTDWRQTGLTPEGATGTEDWNMVQWTDEADFGVTPERHYNLESESTTFDPFGEEVVEDEEEPLPDDEPGGPSTPPQQEDEVVSGFSVYLYTGYWTTTKSVYDAAIGAAAEDLTNNEAREVLRVGAEIDPTFIFPTVNAVINGGIEGKTVGEMGTEIAVAVVPFPIPKKITKAVGVAPKSVATGGWHKATGGKWISLDDAGGAIRPLSNDKIKFTDLGIDYLEDHLSRFKSPSGGMWDHNAAMINDLRKIARGELEATQIHRNFYSHELREMTRLRRLGSTSGPVDPFDYANTHYATVTVHQNRCRREV